MQGKISYSSDGMTITGLSSYTTMTLNTTYNTPKSIEFEVIAHNSSAPTMLFGKIGSTWIYTEMNANKTQVDYCGTKYTVSSTIGKYRIEIDTNEIRLYKENSLVHTYSGTLSTLALGVAISANRSATIKDIIIKAL
jgi:hypothetical protein